MNTTYPPEIQEFVERELERGAHVDEEHLIVAALRVYRELKTRHDALRADVARSLAQAERGEVAPLDTEATKAEARRRFIDHEQK
ncbi:MAG: hypothetical protein WD069_13760 [Planctomycetales bacterium]